MSAPSPLEQQILAPVERILEGFHGLHADRHEARLEVLEAAASRLGGFSLDEYRTAFKIEYHLPSQGILSRASDLVDALRMLPVHPSLALSALARAPIPHHLRRRAGAYYTDFRLAEYLASRAKAFLQDGASIIDPACGTGILLVAAVIAGCGSDRLRVRSWLSRQVYAADRSASALRGARLALASLTDDLAAITEMEHNWRLHDSLIAERSAWATVREAGFDLIVANPPWEKLKISRHEFLRSTGSERHYGADYEISSSERDEYALVRGSVIDYTNRLQNVYPLVGSGDLDLFQAFVELFLRLANPGGCISALLPAGLIRSEGTRALRERLLDVTSDLDFVVMENRAKFFNIDTRFKFIAMRAVLDSGRSRSALVVRHATGTDTGVRESGLARIGRKTLRNVRPDLTLPEVRSDAEWRLFTKIADAGQSWAESTDSWGASFAREVDMTRERDLFTRKCENGALPVVEGRMIHQHRFGVKRYVSGTGRRARWEPLPLGQARTEPQFWCLPYELNSSVLRRTSDIRVGFCDITGQTNERTMLAALIPSGVVCGNKVPTIIFGGRSPEERCYLWIAFANSFSFDWVLRRIVTTTVNYFLLKSVPLPPIALDSLPATHMISAARQLASLDQSITRASNYWFAGELRASIDVAVALAYGLSVSDLELLFCDFPLLDRAQPPLPGELRSTLTRDLVLLRASERMDKPTSPWAERVAAARRGGAVPYVPSQFGEPDSEHQETRNA